MGYGVYFRKGRWAGYGVPAICDQPDCGAEIDRGLAYICGDGPDDDAACGLFFCADHLYLGGQDDEPQMCQRCCDGEERSFDPTPDTPEWVAHMLHDESWEQWRRDNPEQVSAMGMPTTTGGN